MQFYNYFFDMDINEKIEKQIIANYIYKNDLCIRRLVKKNI